MDKYCLRNHHLGRGLCEQIKTQPEGFSPRAGIYADKAQDQGDGFYSNTSCIFLDINMKK